MEYQGPRQKKKGKEKENRKESEKKSAHAKRKYRENILKTVKAEVKREAGTGQHKCQ